MKKILSFAIVVFLVVCCLSLTAYADSPDVTVSEDYTKMYVDGVTFIRFNASLVITEISKGGPSPIRLTEAQRQALSGMAVHSSENGAMIFAEFGFKDGSVLSTYFLRQDCWEAYQAIMVDNAGTYEVDFAFPAGNIVETDKAKLKGDPVNLALNNMFIRDYLNVTVKTADGAIEMLMGSLIISEEEYYYIDFQEANISDPTKFSPYHYSSIDAYKVTNAELLSALKFAHGEYYAADLGFLFNDDFTEAVSIVFILFVFALIPFVCFVAFFILSFRAKALYKKIFCTIWISSAAELTIFTVLACLISFYS